MTALVDVSGALGGLTVALAITRAGAGSYGAGGRWSEVAGTTVAITASVQVLSAKEMLRLPEGQRETAARKLYTTTLLIASDVAAATRADRFTYAGETWEVLSVGDWDDLGGYYKAIATKAGQ